MGYFVCTRIDYFPEGLESDSSTDSEGKILQVVRASSAFPILALIVQTIATIVCFVGHYRKHKVHLILIAGVLSVLAGLCSIVGLFIYISSVSEEYASKARPRSAISDPTFYYHYGWSFWLAVSSFTLTEAAGVLSVYLYVSRHRHVIKKHVDSRKHVDAFPRLRSDSGSQDMYRLTRNQHDYYSAPHLQASDYSTDSSRDIGMSLLNSTERHPSRKLYMPRRERRLPRQHSFETVRKTTPV
ncbi:voltage-dependent calcium channel gamma-5 subunit-like, partial [Saccoglossus kowalevskii]|uniref:Voltage-dependent calcium channel gamma-7 subunit-like n=1 Tax=Saccoglossus kowalevskii TaxID=10224 RepID=A0ABM0MR77_SACKO